MYNNFKNKVLNFPGVSQFTYQDYKLFSKYITGEESVMYSNSWLYTIRSVVDDYGELGYKYYSNDLLFTMTFRHGQLVIGKIFGLDTTKFILVVEIIRSLYESLKIPIVLKKVPDVFVRDFLSIEYFNETLKEDLSSILLDETFPEKVLKLDKLVKKEEDSLSIIPKRFRNGVNRFKNKKIDVSEVNVLKLNPNLRHQRNYLREISRGNGSKYLTYKAMINYIFGDDADKEKYLVRVYLSKEGIEGYYILEKLSEDSIGFYCGLTSIKYGGITEYLDSLILIDLFKMGFKYVYLGGSEHIGVVNYVSKLLPTEPEYNVLPIIYYK